MAILAIFFVIFVKHNVFHILVEFESDRMSPRESAKNERMGARGLNCIFVDSEEKKFASTTLLKFS